MPQRSDLGSLTPNTELATGTEKNTTQNERRYSIIIISYGCDFSNCVSNRMSLNWGYARRLT